MSDYSKLQLKATGLTVAFFFMLFLVILNFRSIEAFSLLIWPYLEILLNLIFASISIFGFIGFVYIICFYLVEKYWTNYEN